MKKAARSSAKAGRIPGTKKTTALKIALIPVTMKAGFEVNSPITLYLNDPNILSSSTLTATVLFKYTDGSGPPQTIPQSNLAVVAYDNYATVSFALTVPSAISLPHEGIFDVELADSANSFTGTLSVTIYPSFE